MLHARDRAGNVFRRLVHVEVLLNSLWDRLNLSTQLLFNSIQVEPVLPVDQVDGQTEMSETSRPTNTVQVGFGILGKVKVDDNVDSLDVYTTGQKIRAH